MRAVVARAAVGVDVLAEQGHFAHALCDQRLHLGDHLRERAAHLLAARVRHDAEAAITAAAFHDRDEGRRALGSRLRHAIELLDLRERDVHLRLARRVQRRNHRRQSVDGLRAEHQVHERRTLENALAFLARDAAADADDETWLAALQQPPLAEVREDLLLRLFAHRAGIQQDDVRFFGICRELEAC